MPTAEQRDQPEDPNLIPNAERIRMRQEREMERAQARATLNAQLTNLRPPEDLGPWTGGTTPAQQPGPVPDPTRPTPWGHETVRTYTLQIGVLQRLKDQCDALLHQMMAARDNAQEQRFMNETVRLPYFLVGDFAVVNRREHGEVARYLNDERQTTANPWPPPTTGQWTPNPAWVNAATTTLADPIITAGLARANQVAQAEALMQALGNMPPAGPMNPAPEVDPNETPW